MLRILTPIVAQSSDEASLTMSGTLPVCAGGVVVPDVVTALEPELPPPQAVRVTATPAASALHTARFTRMSCITLPSDMLLTAAWRCLRTALACTPQRGS